jgi:hypothetical protein
MLATFHVVLEEGLEPSHLAICDFESHASTIPPLQQVIASLADISKVINSGFGADMLECP